MKIFFDLGIEHIVAVNKPHGPLPHYVRPVIYDDTSPYPMRLLSCLQQLTEFDYIFFDHEDMFLYGNPDQHQLRAYYSCLTSGELDHIRMIKAGDCKYEHVLGIPTLYRFKLCSKWIFSIQPGFWKRTVLIDVLKANKNANIWELEDKSQKAVKRLKLRAGFSYRQGAKRGIHHFDNDVYPYIATAIVKGKWNLREYQKELGPLLDQHDINPAIRGTV